jgi:hypothetical protein
MTIQGNFKPGNFAEMAPPTRATERRPTLPMRGAMPTPQSGSTGTSAPVLPSGLVGNHVDTTA